MGTPDESSGMPEEIAGDRQTPTGTPDVHWHLTYAILQLTFKL